MKLQLIKFLNQRINFFSQVFYINSKYDYYKRLVSNETFEKDRAMM